MIEWQKHCEPLLDGRMLYRGIDIGLTREFIVDFHLNTGLKIDAKFLEDLYNSNIQVIRDKKIDQILS